MRRVVVDCRTNTAAIEELSVVDEAEFEAERQALKDAAQADATANTNADTMRQSLRARFAELAQLADKLAAGTATAAEQRRALELCCRGVLRLARLVLRDLDRAD